MFNILCRAIFFISFLYLFNICFIICLEQICFIFVWYLFNICLIFCWTNLFNGANSFIAYSSQLCRLSSACFRIHLSPQTPPNLRQVKQTQTAKHANIGQMKMHSSQCGFQPVFNSTSLLTGFPQTRGPAYYIIYIILFIAWRVRPCCFHNRILA